MGHGPRLGTTLRFVAAPQMARIWGRCDGEQWAHAQASAGGLAQLYVYVGTWTLFVDELFPPFPFLSMASSDEDGEDSMPYL